MRESNLALSPLLAAAAGTPTDDLVPAGGCVLDPGTGLDGVGHIGGAGLLDGGPLVLDTFPGRALTHEWRVAHRMAPTAGGGGAERSPATGRERGTWRTHREPR